MVPVQLYVLYYRYVLLVLASSSSYSHSTTTSTTIDLVVVLLVVGPATGTHFILPVLKYHGTHFRQSEQ